jgi:hypothetical protein
MKRTHIALGLFIIGAWLGVVVDPIVGSLVLMGGFYIAAQEELNG